MPAADVATACLVERVLAPADSELVLTEWTAEGSTDGTRAYQVPLHRHPEAEAWYVLEGVLGVRVGHQDVEVPAGGAVIVPGGGSPAERYRPEHERRVVGDR